MDKLCPISPYISITMISQFFCLRLNFIPLSQPKNQCIKKFFFIIVLPATLYADIPFSAYAAACGVQNNLNPADFLHALLPLGQN